MIGFDEAVERAVSAAMPLGSETVPLAQAHRRVLARPVIAEISAPPCDVSAMDGYAVRDSDLAKMPQTLAVTGESFAGRGFPDELASGSCIRILTGAPVPKGADRVIVQEEVEREGHVARFDRPLSPDRHIRKAGSDFRKGELIVEAGTRLTPRALVASAAADIGAVTVFRQPRVFILSTGDELVEPGTARNRAGLIPESISVGAAALVADWGGTVVGSARLPDELEAMKPAATEALAQADLVIVTGGASVGEKDFAKAMFEPGLDLVFSKVAIKPGKPVWFGRARGALVLGLPGNPTSALVTARLFLAPVLCALTGRDPAEALRWRKLPLAGDAGPAGERETFSRGAETDGMVHLLANQDSSAQKTLAAADLLVRRSPGHAPLRAGHPVDALDF